MPPLTGIFVVAELEGAAADRIRDIQERFDPKLARALPPHITVAGSSGVGPIRADTPEETIRQTLEPIARETAPIPVKFLPPHRFMQRDIVVLPLDPHGPLRALHERIATSGLPFAAARFAFTPHATLSLYPELTRERTAELLRLRVDEPSTIDRLLVSFTREPAPPRPLFELRLTGTR